LLEPIGSTVTGESMSEQSREVLKEQAKEASKAKKKNDDAQKKWERQVVKQAAASAKKARGLSGKTPVLPKPDAVVPSEVETMNIEEAQVSVIEHILATIKYMEKTDDRQHALVFNSETWSLYYFRCAP